MFFKRQKSGLVERGDRKGAAKSGRERGEGRRHRLPGGRSPPPYRDATLILPPRDYEVKLARSKLQLLHAKRPCHHHESSANCTNGHHIYSLSQHVRISNWYLSFPKDDILHSQFGICRFRNMRYNSRRLRENKTLKL